MEKVDVVVIAYNEEENIKECLDAIVKNPERGTIIVVDDGSTDNTCKIVENGNYENLILKRNDINKGRGFARMSGYEITKTKYIGSVDADTVMNPDWLNIMIKEMKKTDKKGKEVDIAFGLLRFSCKQPNIYSKYINRVMDSIFTESNASSGMVFRRSLLNVCPLDITIEDSEDIEWICRLLKLNMTFNTVEKHIGTHYENMTIFSLLKRYYEYGQNKAKVVKTHPGLIEVTTRDTDVSEYMICTLIDAIRKAMGNLGFKSIMMEEDYGEQKGLLHRSE